MRRTPVIAATTKTPNMSLQRLFDPAPRETSVWEETLYLSCEDRPIFDEVRAFSRTYDELHKVALPPAPPSVWEPVWCSWYGIKNDVDADYIRSMVPLLKEMGASAISSSMRAGSKATVSTSTPATTFPTQANSPTSRPRRRGSVRGLDHPAVVRAAIQY